MDAVRARMRRRPRRLVVAAVAGLSLAACSSPHGDPYRALPPAPSAEAVLEDINLAAYGLRSYPCDLFEAPVARCYRPDHWLSVREGRETLAHVHRELLGAGARFWGGSDSPVKARRPSVAGLDLGCSFDYAALDLDLRVAVIGPTGESAPCVNGLPGDGVSEVWIIGADFDPADVYASVAMPLSMQSLLVAVPPAPAALRDTYGGSSPTFDGYYGPELPAPQNGSGVKVLPATVSVRDGIVRGLVQFIGSAAPTTASTGEGPTPTPQPEGKAGAVGVVIGLGLERYAVPMAIRPGESAPFEIPLPPGFSTDDVRVLAGWIAVADDWRGAQLLSPPTADPACAEGLVIAGEPVEGLAVGSGQSCYVAFTQATMPAATRIVADAMVAVFDADGTVVDVIRPYVIRGDGSVVGHGRLVTTNDDLRLAWVDSAGRDGTIGIWVRYVRADNFVLGGPTDPSALASATVADAPAPSAAS